MVSMLHFLRESPPMFYTRGGSVLWEAIKNDLSDKHTPSTWPELRSIFCESFEKMTGYDVEATGMIHIKWLDTGGMSGGQIYPEFFNDAILKFLEARFHGYGESFYQPIFEKWFNNEFVSKPE